MSPEKPSIRRLERTGLPFREERHVTHEVLQQHQAEQRVVGRDGGVVPSQERLLRGVHDRGLESRTPAHELQVHVQMRKVMKPCARLRHREIEDRHTAIGTHEDVRRT